MNTWIFAGPGDVHTPDGKTLRAAVRADGIPLVAVPLGSLVMAGARTTVRSEAWFFARQHARAVLGTDELLDVVAPDAVPDFVLRWEGRDAGLKPNRRMVVEVLPESPYGLADNRKLPAAGLLTRRRA